MKLSDYLALRYPVTLIPAEEGGYVAKILDLPGCVTQGETLEEVATGIEDAKQAWLTDAFESGDAIPLPRSNYTSDYRSDYSGKFIVRTPKSLHGQLAREAEAEGISLNSYIISLLSRAAG